MINVWSFFYEQKLLITHFQFSQICDDHDYGDDNDYGHNATNHD